MSDMEQLNKEYIVIEFIETAEVGTIHKSWIETNEKGKMSCFWPEREQLKLAAKHVQPDKAIWTKWDVRVLSSSDDLKTAKGMEKKAQFTSDINSDKDSRPNGKKQRSRKPPKKFLESSSDSDTLPTPKKKRFSHEHISSSSESDLPTPVKAPSTKTQNGTSEKKKSTLLLNSASRKSLFSPCSSGSSPKMVFEAEPVQSLNSDSSQILNVLKSKVESMERSIQKIRYDIKEILEMQQLQMKGQINDETARLESTDYFEFEKRFPLKNVDEVMDLEVSLKEENTNKLLVEFIKQIGGVSLEDSVKRICVRLFTNEAASNFSWEGRKGKLCLNNMTLIKTIGRFLSSGLHKETFTVKVFEFRLREWFRQAQTRINGKKKPNVETSV